MLTKKLVRFRKASGYLKPRFIDVDDEKIINLATSLLQVYDVSLKPSRAEIDEQTMPLINGFDDIFLAKGLNKLIQDRCEFACDHNSALPELRQDIFKVSSDFFEHLKNLEAKVEDLHKFVTLQTSHSIEEVDNIYKDLPEFEVLLKAKLTSAKELLNRYNVALVQGLLIHTSSMTLTVREPSTAKLRRLFKYLKFFGLLATIYLEDKAVKSLDKLNSEESSTASKLRIEIDGPLSLFENSSKYGIRLASFFPAVCDMEKWQIKSNVKIDNRNYKLSLDESSELKSHYRNFSAYIPDEVRIFHKHFAEKESDWQISGDTPFLKIKGQELMFPDLCFTHKETNQKVFVELFHRWHTWQLRQRLQTLSETENIIVGIDRSLYKKTDLKEFIDQADVIDKSAFLFNDFPSRNAVLKLLKQFA